MLTFYEWKSRGSVTEAILILIFVAWGLRKEHIFMTFFVCVSLPVFFLGGGGGKTSTNSAPEKKFRTSKGQTSMIY